MNIEKPAWEYGKSVFRAGLFLFAIFCPLRRVGRGVGVYLPRSVDGGYNSPDWA